MSTSWKMAALVGLCVCLFGAPAFAQPANDTCATAEAISVGDTVTGTTVGATAETLGFCGTSDGTGGAVWYSVVGTGDTIIADLCNSGFDTKIRVYEDGCGVLTCVGGNDDSFSNCGSGGRSYFTWASTAATTYHILVHGFSGSEGAYEMTLSGPTLEDCFDGIDNDLDGDTDCNDSDCALEPSCAPPANDDCAGAIAISDGDTSFDTTTATLDPLDNASCGSDAPDVWYSYIASCTGQLTLETTSFSAGDTVLEALDACGGAILSCDDDGGTGLLSQIQLSVTSGDTILIRASGWSGSVGTGTLNVSCLAAAPEDCTDTIDNDFDGDIDCADADCLGIDPACPNITNDTCATAAPVVCGDVINGSTAGALPESQAFCGTGDGTGGAVWYTLAGVDALVNVSLCGSAFDTKIRVYQGSCAGLVCVGGNDDNSSVCGPGANSDFTFTGVSGTDYYILVHGFGGAEGDFTLTVNCIIPGDDCSAALLAAEGANAYDNTGFGNSAEPNPTGCSNSFGANAGDIWFSYTPAADGFASFDTCFAGGQDTDLSVYEGPCGNLLLVGCDGDGGDGGVIAGCQTFGSAVLDIPVAGGTEYLVRVGGFGAFDLGPGSLNITFAPLPVRINELRIDQPNADDDEYFELAGNAGTLLDDLTYIVIGDGAGGSGVIESVTSLLGQSLQANGLFLAGESTMTIGTPDLVTTLGFENGNSVTHLLVRDFTGLNGDDLDLDDDGVLDATPWSEVVDSVALINDPQDNLVYSATIVGPDGTFVPATVKRCGSYFGDFRIGPFEVDPLLGGEDSAGGANICPAENNDCDNSIPAFAGDTPFSTVDATLDGPPIDPGLCSQWCCSNDINHDLWYDFIPVCDGTYTILVAGLDSRVAVYETDVCPVDNLTLITCDDDSGPGLEAQATADLLAGVSYKIRIGSFSASSSGEAEGVMTIGLGNDSCEGATPITEGDNDVCTVGATTDGLELDPLVCDPGTFGTDQIENDVWYTWTASTTGDYIVSTCDTVDFDSRIAIYDSTTCPDDPALVIACNDDGPGCAGFTSELTVAVTAGSTYLVRLGGFGPGDSGSGILSIEAACIDPLPSFSSGPTLSGIAPLTVDFLNTSDNGGDAGTTYDWDFGDTATSTDESPSHTYTDCGTFDVTLTANGCGVSVPTTAAGLITTYAMGDTNGDCAVDVADAVNLANYLFGGGAAPVCGNAADVNGDGVVDIADPVYLLIFLFGGGAAPVAPAGPAC